jgi:hypothetical protein
MFTKKITDDDNFMSLSSSAQALYLHLSMSADDDGFCNQINIAMFRAHASVQDLEALLEKRYIYQFENGVIVIKHWRMANALRKDRYTPTAFQEELAQLKLKENGSYTKVDANDNHGCQVVANCLPQVRLGKDSIGKVRLGKDINSSEPKKATEPTQYADVPKIPLNNGDEWQMPLDLYNECKTIYPAVDIDKELGKMRMWCISNPTKRKTPKGISRFVNTWLSKEQDRYHGNNTSGIDWSEIH